MQGRGKMEVTQLKCTVYAYKQYDIVGLHMLALPLLLATYPLYS